jgi:hypothetical protein
MERTLKIKNSRIEFITVTTITILMLISSACGSTGYKTFSIKEGVQGFNFEYPSAYSLIRIDLSNTPDSKYTTIGLGATTNGAASEIYIYVWPTSANLLTASMTLDTLLTNAANVLTGFVLDKKAVVMVDSQIAQEASFTATDTDPTSTTPTGPAYYRVSCFIRNELVIELDMTCDVSLRDVTQGEYDHLLQTFAALD